MGERESVNLEEIVHKMHSQEIYETVNDELVSHQLERLEKLYDFNRTRPLEQEKRTALLKEMFAEIGEGCYIEPPLYSNWAGKHVRFGNSVYANFNLTLVDDTWITVGNNVMIGPNVTICTAAHPIDPEMRREALQYNVPVVIGNNVWIGAGCIILPGVTIGENSVIGAGSVVTKEIPANVVAVGSPCRVMRAISDRDREYYFHNRKILREKTE